MHEMKPHHKAMRRTNALVMHRILNGCTAEFDDVHLSTLRLILNKPAINFLTIDAALQGAAKGTVVCLTFDDGFSSDYEIVLPVLVDKGIKATFFIVTDWIGKSGHLKEHQIRSMYEAGMQIGSHSHTHPNFLRIDDDAINRELTHSRKKLEDIVGADVKVFSFPYGYENSTLSRKVLQAGYSYCCTSRHGLLRDASPVVPRNSINGTMSEKDIGRILEAKLSIRLKWAVEDVGKSGMKRCFPNYYYKIRSLLLGK